MSTFTIIRNVQHGLRFTDNAVETAVKGDVAAAKVHTVKGLVNPLYVLSFGAGGGTGVLRPEAVRLVSDKLIVGKGTGAFDDAVGALHNLGARHGVDGISLSENPALYGALKFQGTGVYVAGHPVTTTIGKDAAFRIDRAARIVMDFAEARGNVVR